MQALSLCRDASSGPVSDFYLTCICNQTQFNRLTKRVKSEMADRGLSAYDIGAIGGIFMASKYLLLGAYWGIGIRYASKNFTTVKIYQY